jgi:hypothetical protein
MTRSTLSLRSGGWLLGAVVALALIVGVVATPTGVEACTEGCIDGSYSPWFSIKCGSGGSVWCQICTFCI